MRLAGAGSVTFEGTEHVRRVDSSEWAEFLASMQSAD
jgi:hypothetical protein